MSDTTPATPPTPPAPAMGAGPAPGDASPPPRARRWAQAVVARLDALPPAWDLTAFSVTLIVALTVLLLLPILPSSVQIAAGQPAQEDYLAPRYFKYESQVLTTQDQTAARSDPANLVYDRDDTLVESQRVRLLNVLSAIRDIRNATPLPGLPPHERMTA